MYKNTLPNGNQADEQYIRLIFGEKMNSAQVASITLAADGKYSLFLRGKLMESTHSYTFTLCSKRFKDEVSAMKYFTKRYPQGTLVPFNVLTFSEST